MKLLAAALLGTVLLVLPVRAGSGCWTASPAVVTVADPSGALHTYYVDLDPCRFDDHSPSCVTGYQLPYVYEESNGLAGQQRQDVWANDVASCGADTGIQADTNVF